MFKIERVTFSYEAEQPVLQNISLEGRQGDVLLVLGHNGAGKSTLLKLMCGILKPTHGTIIINGKDTRRVQTADLAKEIAVTFQNPRDQIFSSTIQKEVAFGPRTLLRPSANSLVENALELFEFTQERSLHPYDLPLSRQKLLTAACAFASGSPILAFDEPSAGLSIPERRILLNNLTKEKAGKLLLIISHDLDLFLPLATRVFVFHQGRLMADEAPEHIKQNENFLRKASLKLPLSMRLQKALTS
ncbi:MAG TPA: ABC transporter ATP-binding protein [Bacteroidota bacterium]